MISPPGDPALHCRRTRRGGWSVIVRLTKMTSSGCAPPRRWRPCLVVGAGLEDRLARVRPAMRSAASRAILVRYSATSFGTDAAAGRGTPADRAPTEVERDFPARAAGRIL